MKKTYLALLLFIPLFSFASGNSSTDSGPKFTHEIGIDVYPVLQDIFKQQSFGIPVTHVPSFIYRLNYKNTIGFRFRATVNNQYTGPDENTTQSNKRYSVNHIDPTISRNMAGRLGIQYALSSSSKYILYAGADIVFGTTMYKNGSYRTSNDSSNSTYVYINRSEFNGRNNTFTRGLSIFCGASYTAGRYLTFSYEAGFEFNHTKIRGNNASSSYSRTYYKANGQQVSNNESNFEVKTNTFQRSFQFVPLGILMVSYKF